MKPRHAVALAALGWYLALPRPDGTFQISAGYDSAAECREQLRIDRDAAEQVLVGAESRQADVGEYASYRAALADAIHSRCIASDDPRLKR